jgi:peptide/nickel transport system substrate-binding protein
MRYKSEKFDSLFRLALREIDPAKRALLYQQADQLAMDDAVVMVIFYEESYRLLQPYVRNFDINPMEFRDLKYTYLVSTEQVEKEYKETGSDRQ